MMRLLILNSGWRITLPTLLSVAPKIMRVSHKQRTCFWWWSTHIFFWQTMHSGFVAVVVSWQWRTNLWQSSEGVLSFSFDSSLNVENCSLQVSKMGKGAVLTLIWDLPLYNSKSWMRVPRDRRMGCQMQNVLKMFGFHSSISADWNGYKVACFCSYIRHVQKFPRATYPALNRFHGGSWENMALVHYEGSHWIVTCCLQVRLILSLCARRFTIDLAKQRNKIKQNNQLPRVHGDTGMASSWKTRRTSLCLKAILSEFDTTPCPLPRPSLSPFQLVVLRDGITLIVCGHCGNGLFLGVDCVIRKERCCGREGATKLNRSESNINSIYGGIYHEYPWMGYITCSVDLINIPSPQHLSPVPATAPYQPNNES